ncbi:MAG: class I SAM-dependent methyltransferase [Candidatus ainarchaeum sp.]|nr:class I SAM-dependent methyltransferase [Candidatus ainarchaeum sp.]
MQKITKISKNNLETDKNVLGKNWNKTYNSYFSDTTNINLFIKACLPHIKKLNKKKIEILYVAGGNGLLGEKLILSLKKHNIKSELTLLDISQKQLDENKNPKTKKVLADILTCDLCTKFDLIIMRSSLDYIYKEKLQVKALKNIKKHLTESGLFINCCAAMPTNKDRDLADKIYASNKLIGKRHFQSKESISELYSKAGFKELKLIGKSNNMKLTEKEHIERYDFTKIEIEKIQKIILKSKVQPKNIKITKTGYLLDFIFPIYLAKK